MTGYNDLSVLKKRYSSMSSDELMSIITKDFNNYTPEALEAAQSVLAARGINDIEIPIPAETVYAFNPAIVEKRIQHAWMAGGAYCAILGSQLGSSFMYSFYNWFWLLLKVADLAIVFGLVFGIYKKSRICAVLMLIYFIVAQIYQMNLIQSIGLSVSVFREFVFIVFVYFFLRGVIGTFQHHNLSKPNKDS